MAFKSNSTLMGTYLTSDAYMQKQRPWSDTSRRCNMQMTVHFWPTAQLHSACTGYHILCLQLIRSKIEVIFQERSPSPVLPVFTISCTPLKSVKQFCCHSSISTPTCQTDDDIQARINLASSAIGGLRSCVFEINHTRTPIKVAVYRVVCASPLLYESEAWTATSDALMHLTLDASSTSFRL